MARSSERTRQRILDAATAEFAERGVAGARVDRIATAAGCNKALLYTYFGNKDALFDAVFARQVGELVSAVPIDTHDLGGYAGRLLDYYTEHPQVVRLALWDRLERGGAGMASQHIADAEAAKVAAIAAAQSDGTVSTRFTPEHSLALIVLLTSLFPLLQAGVDAPGGNPTALHDAVTDAVRRLLL
jgi:AcrR family transcriptional regulator